MRVDRRNASRWKRSRHVADVVREYAAAMDALSRAVRRGAAELFSNLTIESEVRLGYLVWPPHRGISTGSRKPKRTQASRQSRREHDRARAIRTRACTLDSSDYQSCVKEYGDLIARYASDAAARNNLALCATFCGHAQGAQRGAAVSSSANRAPTDESGSDSNYSGDFQGESGKRGR